MSDYPVRPVYADALINELAHAAEQEGQKPTAGNTRSRHSDAGGCSRAWSYRWLGVEPDHPMDLAGIWVTHNGTRQHDELQDAWSRQFPRAVPEAKCLWDQLDSPWKGIDTSGHADLYDDDGIKTVVELKNVGAFAFDKAVGLNRKARRLGSPQGPRISAKIQGALNALALDADRLVIIYFSMEAVSVQLARQVGLDDRARIMAEWHYSRNEWFPWAEEELDRISGALEAVDSGFLAPRVAVNDDGERVPLTPEGSWVPWNCDYCAYPERCKADGPDIVPIPAPLLRTRVHSETEQADGDGAAA